MTPRIHTTGSDNWSSRGQMTEARRHHLHGPVEPLYERPVMRLRGLLFGVAASLLLFVAGALLIAGLR